MPPALVMSPRSRLRLPAILLSLVAGVWAEPADVRLQAFLETHCIRCHNPVDLEGGLDLEDYTVAPDAPDNFARWVLIHDRVESGEMPPEERRRPTPDAVAAFTSELSGVLGAHERRRVAAEGRTVQRRLNRYEYEHAVRDLLDVPWVRIKERLPQDGEAHRYNKSGEALDVSHVQLARYLDAADHALRQAVAAEVAATATSGPALKQRFYARDEPTLVNNFWPREGGTLPDRLAFPVLDGQAEPEVRAGRAPVTRPETRDREAVGKVSSTFSDAGGYRWGAFQAPVGGHYRLRFKGYSVWLSGGGVSRWFYEGTGEEKAPVYWMPLWHRPNLDEVWPGRRSEPIGVYARSGGQGRLLGSFDFGPEPGEHTLEVVLAPGEFIQTDGSRLFRTRVNGTDEQYVNPLARPDGLPGYAVQWMEVEGPLDEPASSKSGYAGMFGDLPVRPTAPGQPGLLLEAVVPMGRGPGVPAVESPPPVAVAVVSQDEVGDARRLLRAFVDRAYRRPVAPGEHERFWTLYEAQRQRGEDFATALVTAYTAVLVSPGFLFVEEQPGPLDDHAVATRLSLLLWNSGPDAELRDLAAAGRLRDPSVLRAQTDRLIDDPRSRRFVDAFTDYWLDLRKFDDTSPSATLYNDYELDDPLRQAAMLETQLYVQEMMHRDLPARVVVDSDFTFVNERLAAHYGLPAVEGAALRKVALPAESVRGGIITQASVLKVTANGTTTSPVIRGNWITERILGYETRPPPPVPAVEPDIRGAVTIRQQLEKHRSDPSCASCHTRMDPPGFALESFDVMGGWRERYRAVNDAAEPVEGVGINGQRFAFHLGLPVDSAGELPDGQAFRDINEFKALLLTHERVLARNLARQLTVYATGTPVLFTERAVLEAVLQRAAANDYGLRTLIHELVQSPLFLHK